ncbi:hypothetical protein DBR32_07230 [Taibaiella sp. KBW10]|uniref:hypothetical protein n=1 Tax=Taibaiella sp. KBW10 TaxID=2153357 RepID=UPI000F5AF2FF|nr:hypothetical protein [Taibaiella sp. KBW10]RQO31731.1 hypothetical protein DBR32_07230 [Taibaiella sp. KBW10]
MKNTIFLFLLMAITVKGYSQKINITKADLQKTVYSEYNEVVQVTGMVYIYFEIINPTKDTLYLIGRDVPHLTAQKPFILIQTQSSKTSKEVFIPGPPSVWDNTPLRTQDIVKVPPNAKKEMYISREINEGLSAVKGDKIALQIKYRLVRDSTAKASNMNALTEIENSIALLKKDQSVYQQNELIKGTGLLGDVDRAIEKLGNRENSERNKIKALQLMENAPFYTNEIVSNRVYVNE